MAGGQATQAKAVLVRQLESVFWVYFVEEPAILEAVKSSFA
jgi:hypothetical protein